MLSRMFNTDKLVGLNILYMISLNKHIEIRNLDFEAFGIEYEKESVIYIFNSTEKKDYYFVLIYPESIKKIFNDTKRHYSLVAILRDMNKLEFEVSDVRNTLVSTYIQKTKLDKECIDSIYDIMFVN